MKVHIFAYWFVACFQALNAATELNYFVNSMTGSDSFDGLSEMVQTGNHGPFATLDKALEIASSSTSDGKNLTINLKPGKYAPSKPLVYQGRCASLKIQTLPGDPGKPAYILGAIASQGEWQLTNSNQRIVSWNLANISNNRPFKFSTLYNSKGEILTRARFPGNHSLYLKTQKVPAVQYFRSQLLKQATSSQSDSDFEKTFQKWLSDRSDVGLTKIVAELMTGKQSLPDKAEDLLAMQSIASQQSGFSLSDLQFGFPLKSTTALAKCKPDCVTLDQARKQTFFMDPNPENLWPKPQSQISGTEIILLQAFEAQRTYVAKVLAPTNPDVESQGKKIAVLKYPGRRAFDGWLSDKGYRYFLENRIGFLTTAEPGQWFLNENSQTLYYKLRPTETLREKKIYFGQESNPIYFNLPREEFKTSPLLSLGSEELRVNNVTIQGLVFTYTDWQMPEKCYGGGQSYAYLKNTWIPNLFPALSVNCNGCEIRKNNFVALGGHALNITGSQNHIYSNRFDRIGANGINLGNFTATITDDQGDLEGNHPNYRSNEHFVHNIVEGNHLSNIGAIHFEGTGVFAQEMTDTAIRYNLLEDVSYIGIGLQGWLLGRSDEITSSIHHSCAALQSNSWIAPISLFAQFPAGGRNTIGYNIVRRAMKHLNDGAGIYVNGPQLLSPSGMPTTNIIGNLVYDIQRGDQLLNANLFGIYLDYNSQNFRVIDNVVGKIQRGAVTINDNNGIQLINNTFGPINEGGPDNENGLSSVLSETKDYSISGKYGCSFGSGNTCCKGSKPCCVDSVTGDPVLSIAVVGSNNLYRGNAISLNNQVPVILSQGTASLPSTLSDGGNNFKFKPIGNQDLFTRRLNERLPLLTPVTTGAY